MSKRTELLILIIATVVIAFLTFRSVATIGLWRVSSMCYLAGLAFMLVAWVTHFNDKDGH